MIISAETKRPVILFIIGILLLLVGIFARITQIQGRAASAEITLTQIAGVALVTVAPSTIPTRVSEPLAPTRTATMLPSRLATPFSSNLSATIPTRTPRPLLLTQTAVPTVLPSNPPTLNPTAIPLVIPMGQFSEQQIERVGISGTQSIARKAWDAGLHWSYFLDWHFKRRTVLPQELIYWRTLRVSETGWDGFETWAEVEAEAQKFVGQVWIIGNEPDVRWQDGVSAEIYAERYHEAYTTIKNVDPTAQIAIAAVTAGTDLRLRYLDSVLATYAAAYGEPMPIDIWTVHAYVLREERDSWGIDIPPGMSEDSGDLYEIDDHDDLDLFVQQIVNFRQWMAENGYRDRPLAVTEYGILLPNDYGFPQEIVEQYLRDSTSLLLTLNDPDYGLASDQNRLVQQMFWFILTDNLYPTGALWDRETNSLTGLGETMQEFINQ